MKGQGERRGEMVRVRGFLALALASISIILGSIDELGIAVIACSLGMGILVLIIAFAGKD